MILEQFLEPMQSTVVKPGEKWKWTPHNPDIKEIFASGAPTKEYVSTYAAEKDQRTSTDRPNEGG